MGDLSLGELQAYGYFALTAFLVFGLYYYIFHIYSTDKKEGGKDYENFSNLALHDNIEDPLIEEKTMAEIAKEEKDKENTK